MNNKKLFAILLTVLLVAVAGIFYACEKDSKEPQAFYLCENDSKGTQLDFSMKDFEKLMREGGVVHNEGLECVYNQLLKTESSKDFMFVSESATIDFIESHPFFQTDVENSSLAANTMFNRLQNSNPERNNLWYDEDENLLSRSQKEWLTRIDEVINQNDDLGKIIYELDEIKSLVYKEGTQEDQYIVIVAVEVGKASLNYWYENYSKWEELVGSNSKAGERWFSLKSVGKADIAGAVGGAAGGALAGAMVGGIGAGPGAAAGAVSVGTASSVANAAGQVLDRIFG